MTKYDEEVNELLDELQLIYPAFRPETVIPSFAFELYNELHKDELNKQLKINKNE